MTMFGINIQIKDIGADISFIEEKTDNLLRKEDERKIFRQFLESRTSTEEKVIDNIKESVRRNVSGKEGMDVSRQALLDFTVSRLKVKKGGHLSVYDVLIRRIIEEQKPEFRELHRLVDKGEYDGRLPFGYPDASKNAQAVLIGKIKDSLPRMKKDYLEYKLIGEKVGELTQNMFYGINKLGLNGERLVNYLGLLFELKLVETAPMEGFKTFAQYLKGSMSKDCEIELFFIKCLRFSYPEGKNLRVISHLGPAEIKDRFGGIFLITDESNISGNIEKFTEIFKNRGFRVRSTIVVADNDLQDNFPGNFENIIPESDVYVAQTDVEEYINNLKVHTAGTTVVRITDLIRRENTTNRYEEIRETVLDSLRKGDGKYFTENFLEGLVEYRFQRDQVIFERSGRMIARERVYQKVASQIAIQVLALSGRILVTNSHGNENKLIAGGKMPVLFADIYKEEKVFENV